MLSKDKELEMINDMFYHCEKNGFKDKFQSDWENTKKYNGKPFKVIERVPLELCWLAGEEPLWKVEIDGDVFDAYPTEIINGM